MDEKDGNASENDLKHTLTVCRICGEQNLNVTYMAKEMMFGTKEEFPYFVCIHCQCMQIASIPEHLEQYYADNYYSLRVREEAETFPVTILGGLKLLDVGCGAGKYLIKLAREGYGELYGCDPYIPHDIQYGDRISIKKCEIKEMNGCYNIIRFGDSFEHMPNPLEVLKSVRKLLHTNGKCMIEIPIFPNAAFDTFGVNWIQMDAPRHLFLHSRKSMEYLCRLSNLKIESVEYNSNGGQYWYSYLYEQGIPLVKQTLSIKESYFSQSDLDFFQECAVKANKKEYGDHAVFTIVCDK